MGAGYGLITLIFQDGRLQGLIGYTSFGGIIPWIPLFMFVLLFGLSMDYHVFILSRIRELRTGGATTRDAVVGGISSSAGVVTSAALIMVAVFSVLATLPIVETKTLGVGLAAAVLIDATVVRGVLLPAAWPCSASAAGTCRAGSAGCPAGERGPQPGWEVATAGVAGAQHTAPRVSPNGGGRGPRRGGRPGQPGRRGPGARGPGAGAPAPTRHIDRGRGSPVAAAAGCRTRAATDKWPPGRALAVS